MVRWLIPCVLLAAPAAAAPGSAGLKNPFDRPPGEAPVERGSLGLKNPFTNRNTAVPNLPAAHDRVAVSGLKNPFTATSGPSSDLRDPFAPGAAPSEHTAPSAQHPGPSSSALDSTGPTRGELKNPWATSPVSSALASATPPGALAPTHGELKNPWASAPPDSLPTARTASLRDPFEAPSSAPRSELLDPFAPARSGGSDLRDPWAPRSR